MFHPTSFSFDQQFEVDEKFPDCVNVRLRLKPVYEKNPLQKILSLIGLPINKNELKDFELYLTINFNEKWEEVKFGPFSGQIKFGIKQGKLKLKLERCKAPIDCRELMGSLSIQTRKEIENQSSAGLSKGFSLSIPFSMSKDNSVGELSSETNSTKLFREKSEVVQHRVTGGGEDYAPFWSFEDTDSFNSSPLKGMMKNTKLCNITSEDENIYIEAFFCVEDVLRGVCITDIKGLIKGLLLAGIDEIDKKKFAHIERRILQCILEPKLNPYLSHLKLNIKKYE
ncbi:hypothetical protein [Egbenema bharatensis]|uniref:hypothetical protein n=1 Tax=Egbenema bharatensis TaxID=3463334 RepID=UPI003A882DBF